MEFVSCLAFVGLLLLIAPLVLALIALSRVRQLQREIAELKRTPGVPIAAAPTPAAGAAVPAPSFAPPSVPPSAVTSNASSARPLPSAVPPSPPLPTSRSVAPNWESLLGVKLFAWIGGFAFFLGVVFFVKYAFDNNLITPGMRIAIGAIVGLALVAVGGFAATKRYRAPAQSLCATGVLVLYADIYAAHAFYALVPLATASVLMCVVTAGALWLATRLKAQSVVWLAALGGYVTPALLWSNQSNALVLFGYVAVLNCALAAVATLKRWPYFVLLAAIASVATEAGWAADFFGPATAETGRRVLILLEAQFLAICVWREKFHPRDDWSAGGTALAGWAALVFCIAAAYEQKHYRADFAYPILFFANVGLLGIAATRRSHVKPDRFAAAIAAGGLAFCWIAEWGWRDAAFMARDPAFGFIWYIAIVLLFAAAPYFCGVDRLWPWSIAAAVGPLQFWFVYELSREHLPGGAMFLLPLAFALPCIFNTTYLIGQLRLPLASADNRLATQIIGILFFVSLVFPVQFEHEWITLGWAVEGVLLLLVYRMVPNVQLRLTALIVLCAAFARLTFNPAVFDYHERSAVQIWNWYLYAYGIAAGAMFLAARLFQPAGGWRDRIARPLLYSLGTILLFLLLNIEIADYFSVGRALTFSFSGNFARDMSYSICWALFAFGLLLMGMFRNLRTVRFAAVALLCLTLAKLFLHDLAQLSQLYRIAAFLSVAIIAIVASFAYQRFLGPITRQEPPAA